MVGVGVVTCLYLFGYVTSWGVATASIAVCTALGPPARNALDKLVELFE